MNNINTSPSPYSSFFISNIASKALFIYVLLCFFPYPAIEIGRSAGFQLAHILNIIYIPLLLHFFLKKKELLIVYFSLSLPSFISIFVGDSYINNLNAAVFQAYGLLTIPIVAALTGIAGFRPIVLAAISAITIHSIIGIWQQVSYVSETFPIIWIYTNPSFALMESETIRVLYGVYTKRSFGIFPEPSSMFASLSPFLLFLIFFKNNISNISFRITLAIFLGLILFYFSKSGGVLYFLIACIPYVWSNFIRSMSGNSSYKFFYLLFVIIILSFIAWIFFDSFQNRAESEIVQDDGSWIQRYTSIMFAINAPFNGSLLNLFFGYGLGDVSIMAEKATGRPSVHSWLVQNFMGSGLVGLISIIYMFIIIFRNIKRSYFVIVGYSCFFMWFICVTLITGYFQLLPIWVFLGVLLGWKNITLDKLR